MTSLWKVKYEFLACGGFTEIQVSAADMAEAERAAIRKLREKFGSLQVRFVAAWKFNPPRRYYEIRNGGSMRFVMGVVSCHAWPALATVVPVEWWQLFADWTSRHPWQAIYVVAVCVATVLWPMLLAPREDEEEKGEEPIGNHPERDALVRKYDGHVDDGGVLSFPETLEGDDR